VGLAVLLAILALLVVYPIVLLAIESFHVGPFGRETGWGIDNWVAALSTPRTVSAIVNTITLSVTREGISIVFGVALAWLIARTDLPGRNWLEFGFWLAVFLPVLTVTLGWIMVFDRVNGLANQLVQLLPFVHGPPFDIFSWWGIIWVHLMTATLPVKVMLLAPALRNLDSSMEEAARMSGASPLVALRAIGMRLITPIMWVVLLIGMMRSLESFEIELILGTPANINVYSTLIYRLIVAQPPQFGIAIVLSMITLLSLLPFIFLQQRSRTSGFATVSGKFQGKVQSLGVLRWPLFGLVLLLVGLMTLVPVGLVITGTFMKVFGNFSLPDPWTLENWQNVFLDANLDGALINTVVIALGAAIAAMAVFFGLAYITVRTALAGRRVLDSLLWLPSALPGVIMGLGYLWLFTGTAFLRPLYGTTFILVLVCALASMTLTTQIIRASLLQLGSELEEASWASGASRWLTVWRVVIPLILPTLAVVGVLAFSAAAKATSSVVLLATRANRPLSVLQLNYMADSNFEAAAVVGVFILVLTIGLAGVARMAGLRGLAGRLN
jgi:iron(III) transport system permease protein